MTDEARCWNDLAAENARLRELIEEAERVIDELRTATDYVEVLSAAKAAATWRGKVDAMRTMEGLK